MWWEVAVNTFEEEDFQTGLEKGERGEEWEESNQVGLKENVPGF